MLSNSESLIEKAAGRLAKLGNAPEPRPEWRPGRERGREIDREIDPLDVKPSVVEQPRIAGKPSLVQRIREHEAVALDFNKLKRDGFITPRNTLTQTSEEFRLIKRAVLRKYKEADSSNANVIMVTSALGGEGKTFTAINLAISIAFERDFRVLLIDGDVRKSDMLSHLGLKAGPGLVDVLSDETLDLADVMLRTNLDGLSIVPSGRSHSLSTELLASRIMADLIDQISRRYADRIIVFDTPPVLLTSEAAAIAQHVGQTVFVVRAERTGRETVKEALEVLKPARNVAFLLNAAHPQLGQAKFAYASSRYHEPAESA